MQGKIVIALGLMLAVPTLPAEAWAKCELRPIAEFHTDPQSRSPVIDGEISGHPIKVLLDTGSNFSWIPNDEARRFGLLPSPDRGPGHTGETSLADGTYVRGFRVGDFTSNDVKLLVGGSIPRSIGAQMVLGDDFFARFDTEFDLTHGEVRLSSHQDCRPAELVYWAASPFQAKLFDMDPLWSGGASTASEALLNGRRVLAQFKTGSDRSCVDDRLAESVGAHETRHLDERPSLSSNGDAIATPVQIFRGFSLGGEAVGSLSLCVRDLHSQNSRLSTGSRIPEHSGNGSGLEIGADFFHAHRVLFDAKDRLVLFTYEGGPVLAPAEADPAAK